MPHCLACGGSHTGKFCPPENFAILICKNCGEKTLMPGDALAFGLKGTYCGKCEKSDWQVEGATLKTIKEVWEDYGKYCTNIRHLDLKKLNTATKYPSILTYHTLGERGRLLNSVLVPFNTEDLIFTEKIDGTNSRIIILPKSMFLIGSRDELLHASGDIIFNPSMGIVESIKDIAYQAKRLIWPTVETHQLIYILYGETYGYKIGQSGKNYTKGEQTGFRLFDISVIDAEFLEEDLLSRDINNIASWRDGGGQRFLDEEEIQKISKIIKCPLTPRLSYKGKMPQSIEETMNWLKTILPGNTNASLDGVGGKPEGIVVRTPDRSVIAKIRFEDYERTLRYERENNGYPIR